MRGDEHVRFGGWAEETDGRKHPHGAPARPLHRCAAGDQRRSPRAGERHPEALPGRQLAALPGARDQERLGEGRSLAPRGAGCGHQGRVQCPTLAWARELKHEVVDRWARSHPKLAEWLETALEDGLACFAFPEAHRRRIRSTNGLERFNQELKRRTRVVRIFPNPDACLRLVTALCVEQSEEWRECPVFRGHLIAWVDSQARRSPHAEDPTSVPS
jgi:hypothetical protein